MTLIVTAATANYMAQVSDRRLTLPDGQLFDDAANKAVILECRDGTLAIAYTGLGFVGEIQPDGLGKFRTDDWLVEVLTSNRAGEMSTYDAVGMLTRAASEEFAKLRLPPVNKRTTFCVGAWPRVTGEAPVIGMISNFESWNSGSARRVASPLSLFRTKSSLAAKPNFLAQPLLPPRWTRNTRVIVVAGREAAVANPKKRIHELNDSLVRTSEPREVIRKLVDFIRRCADDPEEGKYIGHDCEAVFISRELRDFSYHENGSSRPVAFGPHLVGPNATFKDIFVGEGPLDYQELMKEAGRRRRRPQPRPNGH